MTYERTKAKKIRGEHCRFCGDPSVPLVKTGCCDKWICCDTSKISFRGGGYCQFEHEHYSQCYFHYNEEHKAGFSACDECQDFWKKAYGNNPPGFRNIPKYDGPVEPFVAKMKRALLNG